MKNFKRVISLSLSLLMLISLLASCGPKSDNNDEPKPGTKVKDDGKAATITYKRYPQQKVPDTKFKDTIIGKQILEKTKVTVNLAASSAIVTDIIQDFAANDIPDIFYVDANEADRRYIYQVDKAAKDGVLADMTPYLDNFPEIKSAIENPALPKYCDYLINNTAFKGKKFFVPTHYTSSDRDKPWLSGYGFFIRGDIQKTLNIASPTEFKTTEEFRSLLKKIDAGKFKDVTGGKMYAFGIHNPESTQLVSALTRPFDFGGQGRIDFINGKLRHVSQTKYARESALWVKSLVDEGLMDPESFSQKGDIAQEKLNKGKYGVFPIWASYALPDRGFGNNLIQLGKTDWPYQPLGNLPNWKNEKQFTINRAAEAFSLIGFAKGKNVLPALRFLNYVNTTEGIITAHLGAEGEQWVINENGKAMVKDEVFKKFKSNDFKYKVLGYDELAFLTTIHGYGANEYSSFGGNERTSTYQNDSRMADLEEIFVGKNIPNPKIIDKLNLSVLTTEYSNAENVNAGLLEYDAVMRRCFLAKSVAQVDAELKNYEKQVKLSGIDKYLEWLEKQYKESPDKYTTYTTDVQ